MNEDKLAIFVNGQLHPVVRGVPMTAQLVPLRARVHGTITLATGKKRKIIGTWYPNKGLTVAVEGGSQGVVITLNPKSLEGQYLHYAVPVVTEKTLQQPQKSTTTYGVAGTRDVIILFTIFARVISFLRAMGY